MKLWTFTKNQAKDLWHKKVLHIRGLQKTRKTSKDREDLLNYWLPQTMTISIPNAPHMIQITNPKEAVQAINSFYTMLIGFSLMVINYMNRYKITSLIYSYNIIILKN
jgi:hypothetical protein